MNPVNLDTELSRINGDRTKELPELVRSRIDLTLASLPEKRGNSWSRPLSLASLTAAVMAVLVIGSGFVSTTMASALREIPALKAVFKIAGDLGLKAADEKGITTEIGQRITEQGITLEVSEVMYDGSRLSIGYMQESQSGIQELSDVKYEINGKQVHFPGSGTGSRIDDKTYAGVLNLWPEEELPDQFQLKMTVFRIGDTTGKWEFSFPVKKMASTNKVVMPMMTKTYGSLTLTVKKITFTPSSTELDVEIKRPSTSNEWIAYQMTDDQGVVLEPHGGSGRGRTEGGFEISQFKQRFGPVKELPKFVTVRPVIEPAHFNEPVKETRVLMEQAPDPDHPLLLSQGEMGSLKINQVEFLEDKTLVHYQTEGAEPHLQSNPLWIEDESGKKHLLLDKRTELVDPIHYEFVREFPAFKPGQRLTFVTKQLPKPDYKDELEMTIPLNP